MQERYIKLNSVEDIKTFVRAADNCPFDIDVNYNRVYIDGKVLPWIDGNGSQSNFAGAVQR